MKKIIVFALLFIIILTTSYSVFASSTFAKPNEMNFEILNVPNDIIEINILIEGLSTGNFNYNIPLSNLKDGTLTCKINDKSLLQKNAIVKITFTNNKNENKEVNFGEIYYFSVLADSESFLPPVKSSQNFSYDFLTDKSYVTGTYIPSVSRESSYNFTVSFVITLIIMAVTKYVVACLFKINDKITIICIAFLIHTIFFILKYIFELFFANYIIPILLIIPLLAILEYVLYKKKIKECTNKKLILYTIIANLCSYITIIYFILKPIIYIYSGNKFFI
jgi:hypothetical protein